MPDQDWRPPRRPGDKPDTPANRFFQKLGVYLLGVAIGLIFLGWVQYRKQQAVQAQQQSQQSQQAPTDAPTPSDPTP